MQELRKWLKIFYVLAAVAVVLLFWDLVLPADLLGAKTVAVLGRQMRLSQVITSAAGFVLLAADFWIFNSKMRCPFCGGGGVDPRPRKGEPQKCPHCGEVLWFGDN